VQILRVVAALALFAAPAWAKAGGANLYPLAGDGIEARQLRDVEGQIKSALLRLRSPTLTLDSLDTLASSCGPATQAKPACLAKSAKGGVVLTGTVTRSGRLLVVALSAVDGRGRVTGPVRTTIDPAVENLKPLVEALQELDGRMSSVAPALPPVGAAPPPPTVTPAPAAAVTAQPEPPSGDKWLRRGAIGSGVGAVLALGGGFAFGYLAKKTNDDLAAKYGAHTLTTSDADAYNKVDKYSTWANALFVVSGALAAASITCWAILAGDDSGGSNLSRL
jgi:hypothetical protein